MKTVVVLIQVAVLMVLAGCMQLTYKTRGEAEKLVKIKIKTSILGSSNYVQKRK